MRRHLILFAAVIAGLALVAPPSRWRLSGGRLVEPPFQPWCVLVALPGNSFTRIPDPPEVRRPLLAAPLNVAIDVTYDAGFLANPTAMAAFQHAVDIWKTQITSPVSVTIDAQWKALGAGVLGQAGPNYINRGAVTPVANTWYPISLFNLFAGTDTVATQPNKQITAQFSSSANWYLGTDGLTPAAKYDLVSVVLHELGHGLGFIGSMDYSAGTGSWGAAPTGTTTPLPYIFDRFVVNGAAQSLIDTTLFANPSAALGAQYTSANLYWAGANAVAFNGGVKPQLYAPAAWEEGSSIAHLDEHTYPAGNINSLMTPGLFAAESIHDPGPITRGMFKDVGWNLAACTFTLSATAGSIGPAGGTGTVTVTPSQSTCAWTAVSNSSFITITSGASGTGTGTVTYAVPALTSGTRTGSLTIAGATYTLTQGPTLSVDHSTLKFAGVQVCGTILGVPTCTLSPGTGSQTVNVTFTGATPAWTATSSAAWAQIGGGAGTGNGRFTVSFGGPPAVAGTGTFTTTITVSSSGAVDSPKLITVQLTLYASPAVTALPFGSFDTPLNGATGVVGAIPVTGWALDDVGVNRVEVWRNCLEAIDRPRGACAAPATGLAANYVFLGKAFLLAGARPDVEALNPTYPLAYRAGWGFMLLTNALPHQIKNTTEGGQGSYVLSAFAIDEELHAVLLGARTIAVDNDHATRPFGAIDTPTQGGTIPETSAPYNNVNAYPAFGWAMTQAGKCIDTTSTTAYRVFIDGVARTLTAGTSWFAGFNRPDLAAAYPGLCNSTNALAVYYINASALGLASGLHTIAWDVTDSAGQLAAGIGSRFFNVIASSGDVDVTADASTVRLMSDATLTTDSTSSTAVSGVSRTMTARIGGLDDHAEIVAADASGHRFVQLAMGRRLHLDLGGRLDGGYQQVGAARRALPVGSTLDAAAGTFAWEPPAGFFGPFELVFTNGADRIAVTVTIIDGIE